VNLQPIASNRWTAPLTLPCACQECGGHVQCETGYADRDGEPFKAYVCAACAPPLLARQQDDQS
jgi:hypothetical protein